MRSRRKKICRRENIDPKKSELVELLPTDVWNKILEIGIGSYILTHKDLCSLSVSSKYFNNISKEDSLWSTLLALDFPQHEDDDSSTSMPFQSSCMKGVYKYKVKLQLDSLRRTIDDIRGESTVVTRKLRQLRNRLTKKKERLEAAEEFSDAQELWYTRILEELAKTETRHKNVKKRISKMHSSFKKKSKNFSLSLEEY